jgi:hypothetical protein
MRSPAVGLAAVAPARSTVLIPLHLALPHLDTIERTLACLPASWQILISDRTLCDDALERLRQRHGQDPRLRLLARRGAAGWRDHVNTLLPLVSTPWVCIVAQDDSLEPGYLEALEESLQRHPAAGLAFGRIKGIGLEQSRARGLWDPPPPPLGVQEPWREALALDTQWNLGIPYRGLIRRELLQPIPATLGGNCFADQIWIFSIALVSHLVFVEAAVHVKHYHPGATHQHWRPMASWERRMARLREARARLGCRHPFTRELAPGAAPLALPAYRILLDLDQLWWRLGIDEPLRARCRAVRRRQLGRLSHLGGRR